MVLVKLFEAHLDALAILAELKRTDLVAGAFEHTALPVWAVWAAEPPDARLIGYQADGDRILLKGRKSWCSGAAQATHALVTFFDEAGAPGIAAVDLTTEGITLTDQGWHAVGMADTGSVDVYFEAVPATRIGGSRAYLDRPGFWQGGCGIAACWLGGAGPLAEAVRERMANRPEAHGLAHLGCIDQALYGARLALQQAAAAIDAAPFDCDPGIAMRTRSLVEAAAWTVLDHAGRALGAAPWCRNASLARRYADLPVFLRQSHAEHDLEALGRLNLKMDASPSWLL
jgi:alkylation response protein AidB-like acyl-CoA dehydrogenase